MNIAVITAGGRGTRMGNTDLPKQFIKVDGKEIICHTLDVFEHHPLIDAIVIACVEDYIPLLESIVKSNGLNKVKEIIKGGATGQESIYNGICAAKRLVSDDELDEALVLIHDAVRPLIYDETVTDNIRIAKKEGACITVSPCTETIVVNHDNHLTIPSRNESFMARAPQTFHLVNLFSFHERARKDGLFSFTDSLCMAHYYGMSPGIIKGPSENIKITTPDDINFFKTMYKK